ncbi:hypothetical protein ACQKH5_01390 [Hyphomonas sp. NPDC076900]|uniref:hypothetical protein n=1 Tax=unclassified Hyphomonas TaxID=2630699 RepID=UPI003CFE04C7
MRILSFFSLLSFLLACSHSLVGTAQTSLGEPTLSNSEPPTYSTEGIFAYLEISPEDVVLFREELADARSQDRKTYLEEKMGHLIAAVGNAKAFSRPTDEYMQGISSFCSTFNIYLSEQSPDDMEQRLADAKLFIIESLKRASHKEPIREFAEEYRAEGNLRLAGEYAKTADALMSSSEVYATHVLFLEDGREHWGNNPEFIESSTRLCVKQASVQRDTNELNRGRQ